MAREIPDYLTPYEGPIEDDPLVKAFEDFKVNSTFYARMWLTYGEIVKTEHHIITEKLAPWRAGVMAATTERRANLIKLITAK